MTDNKEVTIKELEENESLTEVSERQLAAREEWKAMTNEERRTIGFRLRRKIYKWLKRNPNMPLPQAHRMALIVAKRIIKTKGKYEESMEVSLAFK